MGWTDKDHDHTGNPSKAPITITIATQDTFTLVLKSLRDLYELQPASGLQNYGNEGKDFPVVDGYVRGYRLFIQNGQFYIEVFKIEQRQWEKVKLGLAGVSGDRLNCSMPGNKGGSNPMQQRTWLQSIINSGLVPQSIASKIDANSLEVSV